MWKNNKYLVAAIFFVFVIIVNNVLNFILIPSCLTRVLLHELEASNDYKYVFLGTSHGSYGIDAHIVSKESGKKAINLCIGGEYLQDSYYLLKKVFETNDPDLIVFDMDFDYLFSGPPRTVSGSSIYNLYPFSFSKILYFRDEVMSMEFRTAFFPWMDYRDNYKNSKNIIKTKLTKDYFNYNANTVNMIDNNTYKGRGHIYRQRTQHRDKIDQMIFEENKMDQKSIKYLKKMVDLCKEKDVKFIMITTPIAVEQLKNSINDYNEAFSYLTKLSKANDINYYNFNLIKQNVFSRSLEDYNLGHLYGDSAERYSKVIGKFLNDLEKENLIINSYLEDSLSNIEVID